MMVATRGWAATPAPHHYSTMTSLPKGLHEPD